jgi:microcystin-dependent protein
MSDPFIGQIIQGGWNFAPRGYAYCNGQSQSISQNTALFSLLGTTYGGNGQTTFNLPDLRGRSMINQGQGPGLSNYVLGQAGGTENTTLTTPNLPAHNHSANVSDTKATLQLAPAGGALGRGQDSTGTVVPLIYVPAGTATNVALAPTTIGLTGNNLPFNNLSPYLAVSIVIATQGIFPSRN